VKLSVSGAGSPNDPAIVVEPLRDASPGFRTSEISRAENSSQFDKTPMVSLRFIF